MSYIRGEDREQASFLPARIDDYIGAEAAVRVIDAFAEGLDVVGLGFVRSLRLRVDLVMTRARGSINLLSFKPILTHTPAPPPAES